MKWEEIWWYWLVRMWVIPWDLAMLHVLSNKLVSGGGFIFIAGFSFCIMICATLGHGRSGMLCLLLLLLLNGGYRCRHVHSSCLLLDPLGL